MSYNNNSYVRSTIIQNKIEVKNVIIHMQQEIKSHPTSELTLKAQDK